MPSLSFEPPVYLVLAPAAGALLVVLVGWISARLRWALALLALLVDLTLALVLRTPEAARTVPLGRMEVAGEGITLALRVDALSSLFLVLLAFAATLAVAHAIAEPAGEPRGVLRTIALLLAIASANGAFLAADLLTLYGFAELTSLFLMLLLLCEASVAAQNAGLKLFAAVEVPGLSLLLAILLVLAKGGSLDLVGSPSVAGLGVVTTLALLGIATRAGLVPLHTWLSEALATASWPAAVLAGTLAGSIGIYLLLRFATAGGAPEIPLQGILLVLGAATVVVAAYVALRSGSPRRTIAALVVAQGGFLALGLSAGGARGLQAALAQLAFTLLLVPPLYLTLGALLGPAGALADYALPQAIIRRPLAGIVLAVGLLSAAGLPPFYGFFARTYVFEALTAAGSPAHLAGALLVLVGSGLLLAAVAKEISVVFAGQKMARVVTWWEGEPLAGLPLAIAAVPAAAFAIAPLALQRWLIDPAMASALRLPAGSVTSGMTLSAGLSGALLLLALFAGGRSVWGGGPRPAAADSRWHALATAVDHRWEAGYLDPYKLAAVALTGIGRGVAIVVGSALDRLAF